MWTDTILDRLAFAGLALGLLTAPAAAQTVDGFIAPSDDIEIHGNYSASNSDGTITCYVYEDVMIRLPDSRSVFPKDAILLPKMENGTPTKCDRGVPSTGTSLHSEGFRLDGRWGNFLIFLASDPSGVSDFKIYDVRDGHQVYEDTQMRIAATVFAHDILRLRYIRGVDPRCSLLSDRKACWSHVVASGLLPRGVFPYPPSVQSCKKGYIRGRIGPMPAPDNDLSIITYKVTLVVDSKGQATAQPVGGLQCEAMP